MQAIDADAYGVAALSIVQALAFRLIEANIMTKDDVLDLYDALAETKAAKGRLFESAPERDAALLIETMRAEVDARF